MDVPFSASKMQKVNEEEEKSINALERRETAPALSSPPARGTWDILPDLVQVIILKMVVERKTLLTCRLVNSAWKKIADKTLEKQNISEWAQWKPLSWPFFVPPLPTMNLKLMVDRNRNSLSLRWNHSALPEIVNQKLGSPFPTNSMRMHIDISRDHAQWLSDICKEERNRVHMARELFSGYGHFLTCFSFSHYSTTFEVLNGILSDMKNLKALALTIVKVEMTKQENSEEEEDDEEEENGVEEEEETSPFPTLPSLPNLSHLKIINCDSRLSQAIFNSYSSQITTLETSAYIHPCPQPFTNLKQLKLVSDYKAKPSLLFLQLGPSAFPSLHYLLISNLLTGFDWNELIQMVDSLPQKLVDLYLDLHVDINNEMGFQNLNKHMSTFPDLRKLGINFPRNKMQTEKMGMWLLPRFPNVEVLNLINCPYKYDHENCEISLEDEGTVDNVVATVTPGFWKNCSKLEKILVHRRGYECAMRDLRRGAQI